jgi:hypothetical protein
MLKVFDRVKKRISLFDKMNLFSHSTRQLNAFKLHSDQMLSLECDGEYIGDFKEFDISIHTKRIFVFTV